MNKLLSDILNLLIEENGYVSLNELSLKLKKYSIDTRTMQREMFYRRGYGKQLPKFS